MDIVSWTWVFGVRNIANGPFSLGLPSHGAFGQVGPAGCLKGLTPDTQGQHIEPDTARRPGEPARQPLCCLSNASYGAVRERQMFDNPRAGPID